MSGCSIVVSHIRFWVMSADVEPTSCAPSASKATGDTHKVAGEVEL
jgi:hypothetical protein